MSQSSSPSHEQRTGVINAVSAYLMWGLAPLYFKLLTDLAAVEILVHRVVWSTLFLAVIILFSGKLKALATALKQPKLLLNLFLSASFLALNWFLFIWAVTNDRLLDASLGYFINPLFSVALGMIFLGERLRAWQKFSVLLAVIGVAIQVVILGTLPVISLLLAATFGLYGLLRKKIFIDSFVGLLIESAMMLPLALIFWTFFINSSTSNMLLNSSSLNMLLLCAGIVTTAPLLCFTAAAKRLTLTTVGFFQYIGPSIMFALAMFYYQEPLAPAKLITFALIWLALFVYSIDSIGAHKQKRRQVATSTGE